METIKSVAFEWSADDVQRIINNLSEEQRMRINIENKHEFLEDVIFYNKFVIIGFINDLIRNAIENEL